MFSDGVSYHEPAEYVFSLTLHVICMFQYAESIPHLQESLAINSLQVTLWFHLGYAALHEEDWSLCAKAYQRYCSLDPEVLLSCDPINWC